MLSFCRDLPFQHPAEQERAAQLALLSQALLPTLHSRTLSQYQKHTHTPPLPRLAPREVECLHWVLQGHTTTEIADKIKTAENTVLFYLKSAQTKLGTINRTHTAVTALLHGLVQP